MTKFEEAFEDLIKDEIPDNSQLSVVGYKAAEIIKFYFKDWEPPKNKVVIEEHLADAIENCKSKGLCLKSALFSEGFKSNEEIDDFARAWLDGYEVEEEKKYYLDMPGLEGSDIKVDGEYMSISGIYKTIGGFGECSTFTESEIKAIDDRYMAFAVEVVE